MNLLLATTPTGYRPGALHPTHPGFVDGDADDAPPGAPTGWLTTVLDEIDYGIVLLSPSLQVVHCNRAARRELNAEHPLEMAGSGLRTRRPQDAARWTEALRAATQKGLRRMLTFDTAKGTTAVAVVPTPASASMTSTRECREPAVLVMLGRSKVCEQLSAHGYSSCLGLTPAESAVMARLAVHQQPADIARDLCVALCTVRTHIANIRIKTGASSIRDLVEMLARLPPLTNALRN